MSITTSLEHVERKTELTIGRACVASIVRLAFLDQLRKPVDVLCKSSIVSSHLSGGLRVLPFAKPIP